ncbi:MAG TPA: hypothetical protein GXX19_11155 [Syntrophomonadaceae bacterium]|nr:hypothetical protein [Syntrophomonadaceae bacterium]
MQLILDVLPDLLKLWKSVMPSMLLGCFLGNLFQNTVLLQRLGRVMQPLARLGRLPAGCITSLTLCLADRIAAYAMLAELKNTGVVGAREVVVSFLVSSLPTGIYFTIFFIGPAVMASLGCHTGAVYLAIYLGISFMVGAVGMLLGRLLLPLPDQGQEEGDRSPETVGSPWRDKLAEAVRRTLPAFCRLAVVFMPVTFLVAILLHTDLVNRILRQVEPVLSYLGLPAPVILVITTGVISMVAAIGTLGPILQAGLVTPAEAVIALLVTSVLHYLYAFWSSGLPTNISIFGSKLGGKVSLAALVVQECATCLAIGLVVVLFN